jgi:hypothetical protein
MKKTSKHTITITPAFDYNSFFDTKLSNMINPFAQADAATLRNLMANLFSTGLKTKYYQNSMSVDPIERPKPEFNQYEENIIIPEYKGSINTENFREILFTHYPIELDEKDEAHFHKWFNKMPFHDNLIMNIKFISRKGKMRLVEKSFNLDKDSMLVPYFYKNYPSKYIELSETSISKHAHNVFEQGKETYLKLHHYSHLSLQVYTTVNPEENKVVPAVVVEDMKGSVLEVHCYYKNEYITPDIMNVLKPNILLEDFKAFGYFNERDIEFLEMIRI